jgi:DNA repair protein RadC
MSENEESQKLSKRSGDGVPVYRVALVRESTSTAIESPSAAVRKSSDAAEVLRPLFAGLDREQFVVLMLAQHRPVGLNVVSLGSLTASLVHPREVFKPALLANSAAVIVAHNHPSGIPEPSSEDVEITRRLREAGELLGVRVLDSIILGAGARSTRSRTPATSSVERPPERRPSEDSRPVERILEAHQRSHPEEGSRRCARNAQKVADLVAREGRLALAPARARGRGEGFGRNCPVALGQAPGRAVPELADPERVDPPGRDERCRPRRRAGSRSREGRHGRRKQ